MASATLNSNLMETLVTRGGPVDSHSVDVHSRAQEDLLSPPPLSPVSTAATPQHQSYLPQNSFESDYTQFLAESESQDNSTSGGDATTEDDEGSIGDNLGYYLKRSAEDSSSVSSSKKRRKQVKPIRVSSFEEKRDNQNTPRTSTTEKNSVYSYSIQMSNPSRDDEFEHFRCPHCHAQINSEDELRHHIIEDHLGRMLSEEGLRSSYSRRDGGRQIDSNYSYQEREEGEMIPLNLSRWDSRAHSRSRENGERSPETGVSLPSSLPISPSYGLAGLVPLGPPPFLLPFLQQHQQTTHERERLHPAQQPLRPVSSNGQPQIFNLEAYCDLCNKEFCNKYFLKTHKANKHGIYSPDICTSQMSLSGGQLSTPLVATPSTPSSIVSTPAVSTPLTVASLQTSPLSSLPIPGSPFAGAFIAANMSNLPLRPLIPPHLQKPQLSMSKIELGATHSKNGVINIEAYCEICQKEFCNKYFLKRHKSKIHNIDIEVTIKNTSKSQLPLGNSNYERPDGWCDACKKDIGSRPLLNNHKLNVHGPHIIVPMTSPKDPLPSTESSREPFREPSKTASPSESMNDNFSPWDAKREEKQRDTRDDENTRSVHSMYFQEERLKLSSAGSERDGGVHSDSEKARREFWEERDNQLQEVRNQWKDENFDLNSLSPDYQNTGQEESNVSGNISIKQEPQQQNEDQINKSHINNTESVIGRDSTSRLSLESSPHERRNCPDKHDFEKDENIYRDYRDDRRSNQTPVHDTIAEQPRTPGACSSTDENSRDQGLIARVGQPSIMQAPTGTKFTSDQLRQLGVINPDAFCELCCKEFCNKYFLRTHRIKKHGIYTPEYSDRSRSKDHSPLSLARILERQALEMRSGLSDFTSEIECEICRRSFPSPYMLQMHKYYIHGPGQEILHKEQLFQLQQQHPVPQEQLRQIALQVQQQQKLQSQPTEDKKPLPKLQNIPQSELISNNIPNSAHISKFLSGESEEVRKVSLPQQILGNESSRLPPLSPSQDVPHHRSSSSVDSLQEPDTSEDLRKLQSMILELNRQGEGNSKCKICQKDVGNKYFLRAHLMTEHGILPQSEGNINMVSSEVQTPKTSREGTPASSPSSTPLADNQGFCTICKKDFFSKIILQQHQLSSHGVFTPTSFIDRIRAEIESRDDKKFSNTSRSYCEICNKELCNKYFMKTHMLKMHGINVENGTSGGVTCDICRKELCSKYFLKVHKQNSHGLVDDNSEGDTNSQDGDAQFCPLCSRRFKNFKWLQTHLNSDHGEEGKDKWREIERTIPTCDKALPKFHICSVCGQQLPDLVALHVHFIKNHGTSPSSSSEDQSGETSYPQQLEENPKQNYKCAICHLSFSNSVLLYDHGKSHSPSGVNVVSHSFLPPPSQIFQCSLCSQTVPTLELYQQHLLHHQIQGILNPFMKKEDALMSTEVNQESTSKLEDQPTEGDHIPSTPKRCWKCFECGQKFKNRNQCLIHVQLKHSKRIRSGTCGDRLSCRRRLFRCKKCGAFARSHSTLKKHLKMQHPSLPGVPTSHAQPSRADGQFVMQRFLLNKEVANDDSKDANISDEQSFVPSLVYLPVARKVQRPLTVSFCLTPA